MGWTLTPLGDRALVAELQPGHGSEDWMRMAAAADWLRQAGLAWIVDVIPAYSTVTVVYEPSAVGRDGQPAYSAAEREIERLLAAAGADWTGEPKVITIPVCYGGMCGPDLADCALRSGMSEAEFILAHAEAFYRVALVGFVPGFPYMAGLPPRLAQPRHGSPRPRVAAGSVGIAGEQTGVYPLAVPGGWQLIGRTPLRLFDASRREPAMLRAGDRVSFVPIDEEQYRRIEQEMAAAVCSSSAEGNGNAAERGGDRV